MVTVWESICCINTSEMGSPKDNKLHQVCCDSHRTGAMVILLTDASLTELPAQGLDVGDWTSVMFRLQQTVKPMNHLGKQQKLHTVCPVQTVEEKCELENKSSSFILVLHEFFTFPFRNKTTGRTVDCSTSQVVMEGEPENEQ